jgi:peptide/nickel transport system substrate-binding protein
MKKATLLLALLAMIAIVGACATQPAQPEAAQDAAVQEEAAPAAEEEAAAESTEAESTEAEAAADTEEAAEPAGDLPGAVAYPEPEALDLGSVEIVQQPINEIVTYGSLPEYHEPEWVSQLVADGVLPPVEERLPNEPQILLTSGLKDGIGEYGGSWFDFSACPTAGWNNGAGVTSGWFGIESMSFSGSALVKTGPLYRADQDIEPFPNTAMSWEWSDDGKELTMHLIEGAKWSDGEPFTSEDVLFTWEDMIGDPNVNSAQKADTWTWDGQVATLEAVDDYTIKWTFPVERPLYKFYNMDEWEFGISPAHLLKPEHPKYNSANDYKTFENILGPDVLPQVTMGPWVAVEYKTDELLVMRRNPYYWKVDEEGNQLPYMDEAVYQKGPSGTGRTLCLMAGGCDHSNLENPSNFVEALKRAQEPDAHYNINWGPELLGYFIAINQSANLGVKNEHDAAMRELFRDLRFRQALSHATDRDGIAQSIMRGPFLRAWAGGLYPGAPEFDREAVVYYPYAPETAQALLAELGFEDTDGNGILNWTTGALSGEDLTVAMTANEDQVEAGNTAEALVSNWAQIGIKVNYRPVTSAARADIAQSGEWEMHIWRGGQEFALPFTRCTALAPIGKISPEWHREGDQARELQPFEQELMDVVNQYCPETDLVKRQALINQYNQIFTENLYNVGVFVGRYGLALAKNFKNVPTGTPVFLYQWVEDAIMSEQVWTAVGEQREQVRPNTIPMYGQ